MKKSDDEMQASNSVISDLENATVIRSDEAPPNKRAKFSRFQKHNRDTWNGPERENKEVKRRQSNLHRYDAISSSLELTPYQRKRGREIIDDLGIKDIGLRLDVIAFGLCILLANDDVRNGKRYYPNNGAADDLLFEEMADTLDLSQPKQASILEKLRGRVTL